MASTLQYSHDERSYSKKSIKIVIFRRLNVCGYGARFESAAKRAKFFTFAKISLFICSSMRVPNAKMHFYVVLLFTFSFRIVFTLGNLGLVTSLVMSNKETLFHVGTVVTCLV